MASTNLPEVRRDIAGLEVLHSAYQPSDRSPGLLPYHLSNKQPPGNLICGLAKRTFWLLVAFALLIIGGAVAGGIAPRFVGSKSHDSQSASVSLQSVEISRRTSDSTSQASAHESSNSATPALTSSSTVKSSSVNMITPAPTIPTNPCANTLAFTTLVTWAGVSNTISPAQVYWEIDLGSAKECCERCWNLSPQKCNVWGHFPFGHPLDSGRDSCALVYDYPGSQVDSLCPAGRPLVGIIPGKGPQKYNIASNIGGPGPCAGLIYCESLRAC